MRHFLLVVAACAPVLLSACTSDDAASPSPTGNDGGTSAGPDGAVALDAAPGNDAGTDGTTPPTTDIVQLAVGRDSSCVRRANGTVWCWGRNALGELGVGTKTPSGTPAAVSGVTDAVDVSVGDAHACVVHANGKASCWGSNAFGQLGDGMVDNEHLTPNPVLGVSDAAAVYASYPGFNCIRRKTGAVVCWGQQAALIGAYGDGTNDNRAAPGANVSGITDAVEVAKGASHGCARLAAGGVKCWGADLDGQCGDGATGVNRKTPVIATHATNAVELAAGQAGTCWRLAAGTVQCVGLNNVGQLGNGTKTSTPDPTLVTGLNDAVQLTASSLHACARRTGGKVACWGWNATGQLGDGTTDEHLVPVDVSALTDAVQVGTGESFTCALRATGQVVCWGTNSQAQLGDGTTMTRTTPVAVVGL